MSTREYRSKTESDVVAVETLQNKLMAVDKSGNSFTYPRQCRRLDGSLPPAGEGITTGYQKRWYDADTGDWVIDIDDDVQAQVDKNPIALNAQQKNDLKAAINAGRVKTPKTAVMNGV